MKDAYIIRKSVKRNPLRPTQEISMDTYVEWVESSDKLTWSEETHHGKKWHDKDPNRFKVKTRCYLNYVKDDESSFVNLLAPLRGYIKVQFDYKSTKKNLHDLIDLADSIDCNLWQYSPRRQILSHEIVESRYERTKPIAKKQTKLNPLTNWISIQGDIQEFQIYNKLNFTKLNPTIAKVNKGTSSNSIIGLVSDSNKFYIIGNGIENLYKTILKSGNENDLEVRKHKFQERLKIIYNSVIFRDLVDLEKRNEIDSNITKLLSTAISKKSEILIAKVNKKMF